MKFRSKKAIIRVIWFFLRGLNLVWESATPPTHIWEKSPKKTFFLDAFPKSHEITFRTVLQVQVLAVYTTLA